MPKKKQAVTYDLPLAVLAIDPGVTTGYSVMLFTEKDVTLAETGQWGDPDSVWAEIRDKKMYYEVFGWTVQLVVEQFDKRPGVVNPDFTPKYVNRDLVNHFGEENIVFQVPVAAMNLVKPARRGQGGDGLKRFADWYKQKNVHGNDATRHAIVFGVEKLKHMPLILMGWPKPND